GGRIDARRSLVVALHDDAGHVGYGESPPFELPFYSEETLAGARDLITRVLLPRVAGQELDAPEAVDAMLREGVNRDGGVGLGSPSPRPRARAARRPPARRAGGGERRVRRGPRHPRGSA